MSTMRRLYEAERRLPNRNYAHGHNFEEWLEHSTVQHPKVNRRSVLALLPLVFIAGCVVPEGTTVDSGRGYVVKTIDGCEYIEFDYGIAGQRVYSLTHKGNCKNPIHTCG